MAREREGEGEMSSSRRGVELEWLSSFGPPFSLRSSAGLGGEDVAWCMYSLMSSQMVESLDSGLCGDMDSM